MFKVHLLLKDLTKPSVDVYLKIRLSGVGVDIPTVDGFIPSQTIALNPGSGMLLTSSDLAEYSYISNLVVEGIDTSAWYVEDYPKCSILGLWKPTKLIEIGRFRMLVWL
jgi:hypothetical protein